METFTIGSGTFTQVCKYDNGVYRAVLLINTDKKYYLSTNTMVDYLGLGKDPVSAMNTFTKKIINWL